MGAHDSSRKVGALGDVKDRRELLFKALEDKDKRVRKSAVKNMEALNSQDRERALLKALGSGDIGRHLELRGVPLVHQHIHALAQTLTNPTEENLSWRLEVAQEAREAAASLLLSHFSVENDSHHPLHKAVRESVDRLPPQALFFALFDQPVPMGYKVHLPSREDQRKESFRQWKALLEETLSDTGGFSLSHAEHTAVAPPLPSPTLAALAMLTLGKWEREADATLTPSFQITLPDRINPRHGHLAALWSVLLRPVQYRLGSLAALKTNQTKGYAHCIYDGGGALAPFPVATPTTKETRVSFVGRTDYLLWTPPPQMEEEGESDTLPLSAQTFIRRLNELARGHVLLSAAGHSDHPFHEEAQEFVNAFNTWWKQLFENRLGEWIRAEKENVEEIGGGRAEERLALLAGMEEKVNTLKLLPLSSQKTPYVGGEKSSAEDHFTRLCAEVLELIGRNLPSDSEALEKFEKLREKAHALLYRHAEGKPLPSYFHPLLGTEIDDARG